MLGDLRFLVYLILAVIAGAIGLDTRPARTNPADQVAVHVDQASDAAVTPLEAERPADLAEVEEPPCPCGPDCQCENCQCPSASATEPKFVTGPVVQASGERFPRLRVTVWDRGCGRCEAFKRGAMAELGWTVGGPESQIEIVTVPGDENALPAPYFEYLTSDGVAAAWVGYETRDDFVSRLRRAMGLPYKAKHEPLQAQPVNQPMRTQYQTSRPGLFGWGVFSGRGTCAGGSCSR